MLAQRALSSGGEVHRRTIGLALRRFGPIRRVYLCTALARVGDARRSHLLRFCFDAPEATEDVGEELRIIKSTLGLYLACDGRLPRLYDTKISGSRVSTARSVRAAVCGFRSIRLSQRMISIVSLLHQRWRPSSISGRVGFRPVKHRARTTPTVVPIWRSDSRGPHTCSQGRLPKDKRVKGRPTERSPGVDGTAAITAPTTPPIILALAGFIGTPYPLMILDDRQMVHTN